jgi:hypothetical protein
MTSVLDLKLHEENLLMISTGDRCLEYIFTDGYKIVKTDTI